MEMKKKMS